MIWVSIPKSIADYSLGLERFGLGLVQGAFRLTCINTPLYSSFCCFFLPPEGVCAACPGTVQYPYGDTTHGVFCCSDAVIGESCSAGAEVCCVFPGSELGCQGVKRCGNNLANETICGVVSERNNAASSSFLPSSPSFLLFLAVPFLVFMMNFFIKERNFSNAAACLSVLPITFIYTYIYSVLLHYKGVAMLGAGRLPADRL